MLTCRAELIRAAREIGQPLPDEQRIALGVTLIKMAEAPDSFAAVTCAERMVRDHGQSLLSEALRTCDDGFEAPFQHVTIDHFHEQSADRHPGGRGTAGMSRSRGPSSLRAAWALIKTAERQFSESFWGDLIGMIFLIIGWLVLLIAGGVLAGGI
ncbi:MAG: hypothetical protein CML68_20460 [Rhodobacteraceae bacterium]|nr:hypothetical protein [Paracoccaceae bacterium]